MILQPAAEATLFITSPSAHSCANPVTSAQLKSSLLNGSISLHAVLKYSAENNCQETAHLTLVSKV